MNDSEVITRLKEISPTGSVNNNAEDLHFVAQYELQKRAHPPICIVKPGNSEELANIIQFTNDHNLCLTVTSSTGKHRKGGITNQDTHILVDLSHWKKIDLIDRRNRVCRVEPGVTYSQLLTELASHGMTIPMPLAPREGKSVLAATMDREPSTWANKQWDSGDPVCSTEFFFGNGERFRTGAAGGPGSIEQQRQSGGAQKYASGPSQTDFHRVVMGSQGTFGVVNWITLRTEILPTLQEHYLVCADNLPDLFDFIYAVQRGLLGEQSFIMNRTAAALLMSAENNQAYNEFRNSLPEFLCLQSIAGFERLPKERLVFHKEDIERIAHDSNLHLESLTGKLSATELFNKATHVYGEEDWRDTLRGGCLSIIFQSTLDRVPSFVSIFKELSVELGFRDSEIGIYIQPIVQNHACHIELLIAYNPHSTQEIEQVQKLERQGTRKLMDNGAFFSRPYGSAADLVWNQNPSNTQLIKTIKKIFDPKNVLQRGKWFKISEKPKIHASKVEEKDLSDLEKIIGKKWVSTAPCVRDTYAFYMNPETINKDGSLWLPRPAAVVMPRTTSEVQMIMEFCCTSRFMAKPISTGFHAAAAASNENVIILDLKRMNQTIEIDIKNQIAVIEPYVRAIDLQTEIIKEGLTPHIVSSGATHSLLASHAAAWGYGVSGAATSFSGRNLLGLEWVLPTGEVITLGSAGSGCGWFTADGPGPSMRGIVRGFSGTLGGLGVFTKAAIKLYKFDGPREWEIEGRNPKYILKKVPPRCAIHAIAFPSREAERDGGYKMGEAELNFGEFRTSMFFTALGLTETNEELKIALESGIFQKIANNILSCAIFAGSDAEYKWKMKALKQIRRETKAIIVPMNLPLRPWFLRLAGFFTKPLPDPLFFLRWFPFLQDIIPKVPLWQRMKREKQSTLFWLLFRNANNTQAAFRPSQGMATMLGAFDTWDLGHKQAEYVAQVKQPYIKSGLILNDGGDLGSGGTFESGHLGYLEGIILYNPGNPQSSIATRELVETGVTDTIKGALGVPIAAFGVEVNRKFGPACGNYHIWLSRIKTALDPSSASDPFFYAEVEQTSYEV